MAPTPAAAITSTARAIAPGTSRWTGSTTTIRAPEDRTSRRRGPIPDSLSEFRVVTSNPTADIGRNSGANVLLVTKSGTNEFHGNGFWFYRTPRLNANEWATNFNNLGKRQFVQNIYGGSIGGPIWRNKTFFFVNIQRLAASETPDGQSPGLHSRRAPGIASLCGGRPQPAVRRRRRVGGRGGQSVARRHARHLQRRGQRPAETRPRSRRSPRRSRRLRCRTTSRGGDGFNTAYYTWTAPVFERQQDNTIRIDHQLSDKHWLFARGSWGYQNTVCDAANSGTAFFPGEECNVNTERDPKNIAASWRYVVTPDMSSTSSSSGTASSRLISSARRRSPARSFSRAATAAGQSRTTSARAMRPVLVQNLSYAIGNLRTIRTRQFVDNLTFVRGAHTFKTGFNIRFVQHADIRGSVGGANANTTVNFNPTINTVGTAAFNIPSDLNVQFDRPEFERSINFLLGRSDEISPRVRLQRQSAMSRICCA